VSSLTERDILRVWTIRRAYSFARDHSFQRGEQLFLRTKLRPQLFRTATEIFAALHRRFTGFRGSTLLGGTMKCNVPRRKTVLRIRGYISRD
jgi:hypothetical protein